MRCRTIVLVIALLATVRSAFTQSPPDTAVCYRLAYPIAGHDDPSQLFAEYIEIQTAHDRIARSGVGKGKSLQCWRMFLTGGTWEHSKDTLIVHFTNGFSGVRYDLAPLGKDSLSGQVAFLYDVDGQSPPPRPVTASRLGCDQAYLQSPPYTQADADQARQERRLEELRDAEARRIQAIATPLAGTYEFMITLPGSGDVKVYGRTESHPADPVWHLDDQWNNAPEDTITPYRAEGYQLRMMVAYSPDALPRVHDQNDQKNACTASFTVSEKPASVSSSLTAWRGDNDILMAASRCASHGPVHDALLRASGAVSDVWFNNVPGQTKGDYVLSPNGDVSVSMEVARRGVMAVKVYGRRIASTVLSAQ